MHTFATIERRNPAGKRVVRKRAYPVAAGTRERGLIYKCGKGGHLESLEKLGLRLEWCDEISRRIGHRGWFTDDDGISGRTYRGFVARLLHGRGFLSGWCDMGGDYAMLSLDIETDLEQAACNADELAEIAAEKERDYNCAQNAGVQANGMLCDAIDAIKTARALRAGLQFLPAENPAVREILAQIESLIGYARQLRSEAWEIARDHIGTMPYAFREGWGCA